ncbi:MAG: TfoX/Sxy family protein [Bacteroidales bacterium]|nr:TfoX/Sxy family protein [Bacteroidales bacterium]MBN2818807.1 TfoX/Sxy family protein [Bacteroidales bacterium]
MNSELEKLPNIGKTLAEKLINIGIKTSGELIESQSEDVFIRLNTIDETACINILYAIEGAIQGIRWHNLDKSRKEELSMFYNNLNTK